MRNGRRHKCSAAAAAVALLAASPAISATAADGRAATRFSTAVAVDAAGRAWVGSEQRGLWRFDPDGTATNFTTADGLGGDAVHAVAVDRRGRVWAGHVAHGVSVSADGKTWRNYDLLTGPLGERVFAIAASPIDDSVWIATNRGLSRYDDATRRWTYVTREHGLPGEEVKAVAIDAKGVVYAGTLADGLAIGSPQDGYAAWRTVSAVAPLPAASRGEGLPSNSINAVLVARDGTVYVGTTWGLARSGDGGRTFTYDRGRDWAARVNGATAGAPEGFAPDGPGLLAEDYVASLGEGGGGRIYVGHRRTASTSFHPADGAARPTNAGWRFVTAMATVPGRDEPVMTTYGDGPRGLPDKPTAAAAPPTRAAELPAPASPPTDAELAAMLACVNRAPAKTAPAAPGAAGAYLGSDWVTLGDALDRYGWQLAQTPAFGGGGPAAGYDLGVTTGPHVKSGGGVYSYYASVNTPDPRGLWTPAAGARAIGEWNDGTWQAELYPPAWEGPDLWFRVTVPKGVHRASVYLMNNDPEQGDNRFRDYVVELRRRPGVLPVPPDDGAPPQAPDERRAWSDRRRAARNAEKAAAEQLPALARTRATDFRSPFYAQFAIAEGDYWIVLRRDGSFVTKAAGVFFDRLVDADGAGAGDGAPRAAGGVGVRPAHPQAVGLPIDRPRALWAALDAAWDRAATAGDAVAVADLAKIETPYRLLAYRAASAALGDRADEFLARWRHRLPLWTPRDRTRFTEAAAVAHERHLDEHPSAVKSEFAAAIARADQAYYQRRQDAAAAPNANSAGAAVPPAAFDPASIPVTATIPSLKEGVAQYLSWKVNDAFGSFGGSPTMADPKQFLDAFGGGQSDDPKQHCRQIAHLLKAADGFANRRTPERKRIGLAAALAAAQVSADRLKDPWLTRRVIDAFVVPLLPLAADEPDSPVSKAAVAKQVLSLYAATDADDQATLQLEEKARASGLPVDE